MFIMLLQIQKSEIVWLLITIVYSENECSSWNTNFINIWGRGNNLKFIGRHNNNISEQSANLMTMAFIIYEI